MTVHYIFPVGGSPWLTSSEETVVDSSEISTIFSDTDHISLSLLFQAAVSYASEELDVTFICQKPLVTLPKTVHGMPQPDAKTIGTVKFLYLSTVEELTEYCSSVHLKTVLPDILIVSDFHHYLSEGHSSVGEHTAARLLALILDAFCYIKKKKNLSNHALLMSCNSSIKWISSVAKKINYAVLKLTENEFKESHLEWSKQNKHYLLKFVSEEQLFLKHLTVKEA
ncbi:unnamed protein product [Mytilus coruscus]|uniref:Uncharacterized protein n=1 Tax=Mytilus coruscus TaxID=42192 RepID=A0A6J8ATG6_MYTCO|nr:unnamed protein product [Mytilus coruscus]